MTRMLVIGCAAMLAFAGTANAQIGQGVRQPQLEARLPTPVEVYCAPSGPGGAMGWTWLEEPVIYLSRETCDQLARGVYAYAFFALYHEWWHQAFQERDESDTNTGAATIFRYALRHYWGFDEQRAQTYYRAVFTYAWPEGYGIQGGMVETDPLRGVE